MYDPGGSASQNSFVPNLLVEVCGDTVIGCPGSTFRTLGSLLVNVTSPVNGQVLSFANIWAENCDCASAIGVLPSVDNSNETSRGCDFLSPVFTEVIRSVGIPSAFAKSSAACKAVARVLSAQARSNRCIYSPNAEGHLHGGRQSIELDSSISRCARWSELLAANCTRRANRWWRML